MSGGVLSSNPIGASGMLRFAEAAMQVRGMAGEHQVDGARTAVGHAYGGGSQFFAMWVVGADKPMTGRLEGKVAIVTGAARGQGEAEARRFVAEGAQVLLTDVLDDEGEAVAAGARRRRRLPAPRRHLRGRVDGRGRPTPRSASARSPSS